MKKMNFVGIDVSKAKLDVCLLASPNTKKLVVSNDLSGYKTLLSWLNIHTDNPVICLEATGHYSDGVADYLYQSNKNVSVVNPFQVKQFSRVLLTRNKNDTVDAEVLALYAEKMEPRPYIPKTKNTSLVRELNSVRSMLVSQRTQLKNQLESCSSPTAKKYLKSRIKQLEKEIKKLDEEISKAISKDDNLAKMQSRLLDIKGVGLASAHAILAYLPDIHQFGSAKALAAYAGLSPKQRESGTFKGKTCVSKYGSEGLRKSLYMAALSAKRYNEHLRPFVLRLEKNGLKPKAIIVAVMRKLLHIIYGMFKHDRSFDPSLACRQ